MFDVKSDYRVKKCVKEGYSFDNTFSENQKMEHKLTLMLTKVTKEFAQAEVSRMKKGGDCSVSQSVCICRFQYCKLLRR